MCPDQRTQQRSVWFWLTIASDDLALDATATQREGRLDLQRGWIDLARLQAKFIR